MRRALPLRVVLCLLCQASHSLQKQKQKVVEDKTFGMKNKKVTGLQFWFLGHLSVISIGPFTSRRAFICSDATTLHTVSFAC